MLYAQSPVDDINGILDKIMYISIPEGMEADIPLDPAILLPVELPQGNSDWNLTDLSWEMIIAAMLKILAHKPDHENGDYFRDFIMQMRPDIVSEMTNAAIMKARNRDFNIAEEILLSLTNLQPDNLVSAVNLSLVYEQHAETYEQIDNHDLHEKYLALTFESYNRALEIDPESADLHFNVGYFHLTQKNYAKVQEHFQYYLAYGSDDEKKGNIQNILAEIEQHSLSDELFLEAYDFIRLGKEEAGILKIKEYLEEHDQVWNGWFLLGWAYRRLKRYTEGRDAFIRAIELGSDQTDTYNEIAICLMELDELEDSKKFLVKALQQEPENIKIISNLGLLAEKHGDIEEARRYYKTVIALEPNDTVAIELLKKLPDPQ